MMVTEKSVGEKSWDAPNRALEDFVRTQLETALSVYKDDPKLLTEHYRQEESFRTTGYADRQITELVQNAADAITNSGRKGSIEVVLTDRALYCANEGLPFDRDGLEAVTHAYLSEKRDDEIGRYGLGFKSVLAVTSHPLVLSRSVSFQFGGDEPRRALSTIANSLDTPILRIPSLVDPIGFIDADLILQELAQWASTIVVLPLEGQRSHSRILQSLERQISEFQGEFMLFSRSVSRLCLRVETSDDTASRTEYSCTEVEDDVYELASNGAVTRWRLFSTIHEPSKEAITEVSEAITRKRITLTLATPIDAALGMGAFWANFPLDERSSAKALFNAPWALNEDRTRIAPDRRFNDEIVDAFVDLFLDAIPLLRDSDQPSRNLDYMPSRTREVEGPTDETLSVRVRERAVWRRLIPDSTGELRHPLELIIPAKRTFKFTELQAFAEAPHTPSAMIHPDCYRTGKGRSHVPALIEELLRESKRSETDILMFFNEEDNGSPILKPDIPELDVKRFLHILAYSNEERAKYSAQALFIAARLYKADPKCGVLGAHFIATNSARLISPRDHSSVFLPDPRYDAFEFQKILPELIEVPGVPEVLHLFRFERITQIKLCAMALNRARTSDDDLSWEHFWTQLSRLGVSGDFFRSLQSDDAKAIKIMNRAGEWTTAERVLDLSGMGITRLPDDLALAEPFVPIRALLSKLGLKNTPSKSFKFEDDRLFDEYLAYAQTVTRDARTAGAHPDFIDWTLTGRSVGPVSLLVDLRDPENLEQNATWSAALLKADTEREWNYRAPDGTSQKVSSPIAWAVTEFGYARTPLGIYPVKECIDPSMREFERLLPIPEDSHYSYLRSLPKTLDTVPVEAFESALADFDTTDARQLTMPNTVRFDVAACEKLLAANQEIDSLPAYHGLNEVIPAKTADIVVIPSHERLTEVIDLDLPYLLVVDESDFIFLTKQAGLRDGSSTATLSITPFNPGPPQLIADVLPSLRRELKRVKRIDSMFVICDDYSAIDSLTGEEVSTDGALDGNTIYIDFDPNAKGSLEEFIRIVDREFKIGMSDKEIETILETRHNQEIESLKTRARACKDDASRLLTLVRVDDLNRDAMVAAANTLGVGELTEIDRARFFLAIYGIDALKELRDVLVKRHGEKLEVPREWTGKTATRRFVTSLGFSEEFAGQATPRQNAVEVASAPPYVGALHHYQDEAVAELSGVLASPAGNAEKAMLELPTGSGKTRVAVESAINAIRDGVIDRNGHILWIAQTKELCDQAVQNWLTLWQSLNQVGVSHRSPDRRPLSVCRFYEGMVPDEPTTGLCVVVATDAKLREHLENGEFAWIFDPAVVFVDEAHRVGSKTYNQIFKRLGVDVRHQERPLIGLSATPFKRSAEETENIAKHFNHKLIRPDSLGDSPIEKLQELGFLATPAHEMLDGARLEFTPQERTDAKSNNLIPRRVLKQVGKQRGRNKRILDHVKRTVDDMKRDGLTPKILVFMPSVLSAQALAGALGYLEVKAASVSGQSSRWHRREVINRFRDGDLEVLVNCDVLTQGFDAPEINAVYVARPTMSPGNYIQMVGRGLRGPRNGGSDRCLVVDLKDTVDAGINLAYNDFTRFWSNEE